jgi:hypothetical protein
MTAGLAIQATTGLRSQPISPSAGLGVAAACWGTRLSIWGVGSVCVSFTPIRGRSPVAAGRLFALVMNIGGHW